MPDPEFNTIRWPLRGEARLVSVLVECIEVDHPARESASNKTGAFTNYKLVATANISYKISEPLPWETDRAKKIAFEALSNSGVALRSSIEYLELHPALSSAKITSSIFGFSEDEIRRVESVRVRWDYGS